MNVSTGYEAATYGTVSLAQAFEVDYRSRRVIGMCVQFEPHGARMFLELSPGEEGSPCIRDPLSDGIGVAVIKGATVVVDHDKKSRLSFGSISPHPSYLVQCPQASYIGCLDRDGPIWAELATGLLREHTPNGQPSITFRSWRIVRRSTETVSDAPICEFSPKSPT